MGFEGRVRLLFCQCQWNNFSITIVFYSQAQFEQVKEFGYLTHISIASLLWDIVNQCRPRSDAASGQGLHCLLSEISITNKTKMKKIYMTPLKWQVDSPKPCFMRFYHRFKACAFFHTEAYVCFMLSFLVYVYFFLSLFFQSNDDKITFISLYNILCHVCICLPLTLIGYSCAVNKILFYSILFPMYKDGKVH